MEKCKWRMKKIADELKECRKPFLALGDETRQQIIIALLESDCNGIRVGEITKKTNLSRPAVSHHLRILKDAGMINMRREGTKNYYFVDASESQWKRILDLVGVIYESAKDLTKEDPRKVEKW
ncbi:DNA-binding transcriptional regulator, ArsR family [Anaerosporobacter mobilis DSM 15930]|jgi:DNA-binding transcriptional ArsR family regulator|uniref:DNA-binding transcriptional regulator, ArsR family n=1 Tax=Anaerosporobacter mobilis DSM 15930 TaxID=1120996 RepID=A0A1M7JE90_9FIRM|nr:metalloregulator ArsR/SmtB family transcription factor [Anaerosporobacter mobilis]SHM50817.1 DNA-binding transcriptional regulator, ArsR family [Anaerosporobacter mobilis DSM 15930]